MPISVGTTLPEGVKFDREAQADSSWLEVNSASFQTESVFANWIDSASSDMPEATEEEKHKSRTGEFNSLSSIQGTQFEGSALEQYYTNLENQAQVDWMMERHQREIAMRNQMGDGFWKPMAGNLAGAVAGPISLAMGIGYKLPATFGKRGLAAMGINIATTAMDEFMLHQQQDLRTKEETMMALGFSGLLGYGLGAAGGTTDFFKPQYKRTGEKVSFDLKSEKPGGAAKVMHDITLDDYKAIWDGPGKDFEKEIAVFNKQAERYEVSNEWAVKIGTLGGVMNRFMPDMHMATNTSKVMRMFAGKTLNHPLMLEGHKKGLGEVPLDSIAARWDEMIEHTVDKAFAGGHAEYIKTHGKIPRPEFDKMVQKAVARGVDDSNDIIKRTAKAFDDQSKIIGREAVKLKILDGDANGNPMAPLGDKNWFLRTWSTGYALREGESAYAKTLTDLHIDQLQRHADSEALKGGEVQADLNFKKYQAEALPKMKAKLKAEIKGKEKLEVMRLRTLHRKSVEAARKEAKSKDAEASKTPAQDAYDLSQTAKGRTKIEDSYRGMHKQVRSGDGMEVGGTALRVGFDGELASKTGRTVDIPTEYIPDDFLEGDAVIGATRAMKRLNRQILMKNDERFGDDVFQRFKDMLEQEYDAHRAKLDSEGKSTKKLSKEFEKNKSYINHTLKEYYGIRPPPANTTLKNIAQSLKMLSIFTKLGSVMASTLPEVAAALNTVGVRGYMRHVSSWVLDNKSMIEMTKAQKADYALSLDASMAIRLGEMGEYDSGMSAMMKSAHKATDVTLDKAFGLGIWTRQITAQTGVMIQSKIGRIMLKKNLSKQDVTDLARIGIDKSMFDIIRKQVIKNHKKAIGGSVDMRIGQWENKHAAESVINAVFAEVENTIIKPRTGSTPFIGKSAAGSLAFQFKQFLMASTSRYWVADLQRLAGGDIRAAERMIGFMGMGYLSWQIKKNYLYNMSDKEESTGEMVANALSHGGGMGVAMELYNWGDQMINGDNSRYAGNRDPLNMFVGPGVGLGVDLIKSGANLTRAIIGKDLSKGDIRTMRRTLLFNNWIPARHGFNKLEEITYDQFGKRQ